MSTCYSKRKAKTDSLLSTEKRQLEAIETQKFKEIYVEKETEVTTFFISEANWRNNPHIHVQFVKETIVATVDSRIEISIVTYELF